MRFHPSLALTAAVLLCGSSIALSQETDSGWSSSGTRGAKKWLGNSPPVCNTGGPYVVECNGVSTFVQLDATGSFDPNNDPLTYEWIITCPNAFVDNPTSPTPLLFIDMSQNCELECGSPTIRLRVRDGFVSTFCVTSVFVEDTTPPTLVAPLDLTMLWAGGHPTQTDPTETGFPVAFDDCDNAPLVLFTDVVVPGVPPSGIEQVVTRTWSAVDRCGIPAPDVAQVMTIVGPSYYNLEIAPGTCPGYVPPDVSGTFESAALLGSADLDVATIDISSLSMRRADGVGSTISPLPYVIGDLLTPDPLGACHVQSPDGLDDAVVLFDHDLLFFALELDLAPPATPIAVLVTGTDFAGRLIERMDTIVVGSATGN